MPTLYLMIGVPAAGKTTWVTEHSAEPWMQHCVYLSSDHFIEEMARQNQTTYQVIFDQAIGPATEHVNLLVDEAILQGRDIIWDQTHVSRRSRQSKLQRFPSSYQKIALFFPTPETTEWKRRLESRPDKTIPNSILQQMNSSLEEPRTEEGFHEVWTIRPPVQPKK